MPSAEWTFDAIGTPWAISTREPIDTTLRAAIAERIETFDRTYSRFRPDSLVSQIASTPGSWLFPADAAALFDLYRELYTATSGSLSPLVGERLENLGYDRAYSLLPAATPVRVPAWDDAIAWDGERLTTVRPVVLDVGAAGKGYLVDIIAAMLRESGVDRYVIDASGDILVRADEPLRIALEHPADPTKAIGVYEVTTGAICASASNRRAWGNGIHHVIDAVTGEPTRTVVATWAMSDMALVADGLATALFFRGAGDLPTTNDFTYVRLFAGGTAEYSTNLPGEIFT